MISNDSLTVVNSVYPDISGNPLNFSLLDFDKKVFLDVSGILSKSVYDPSFAYYDSIANIDVSLVNFRNMFAIESDSVTLTDLSNPALFDNVHFIVYEDNIELFIPNIGKNSIVTSGSNQTTDSLNALVDQHVHNDFVRYLANLLFNTPYATELFINQSELVDSTTKALDYAWDLCKYSLHQVSTTSTNSYMSYDASGQYHYLNDSLSSNYVSEVYNQIVSKNPGLLNTEVFYDVSAQFYYFSDTLPVDSSGNNISNTFNNLYNQLIINYPELSNKEMFYDDSGNFYYISYISGTGTSGTGTSGTGTSGTGTSGTGTSGTGTSGTGTSGTGTSGTGTSGTGTSGTGTSGTGTSGTGTSGTGTSGTGTSGTGTSGTGTSGNCNCISGNDISGNGISNICGEIYKQLVSRDPERFQNMNTLNTANDSYNSLGGKQFYSSINC
jgi:hypothetical protein